MTLSLNSLRLRNFGPYYGDQNVELATPTASPVVLIHGENTLGKTQLFAALRWCLYGTFVPQQSPGEAMRTLQNRFNRIALREGDEILEVQVNFTAGDNYVLTRRAMHHANRIDIDADLRIGSTVVAAADIDAEIGRLLHPQISEFFLFDAELLQRFYDRLNTERERAFIRESIESVLGIPALQLAERDIGELAADAVRRQARAVKERGEAERLNSELKALAEERRTLEAERLEVATSLRDAERTREQLRDSMSTVEELQADAREQELLEANVADGEREEALLRNDLRRLLSTGWLAAAARPLAEALTKVREANTRAQQEQHRIHQARARVALLEDRIRGGTCPTCGQALPEADQATRAELPGAKAALEALLDRSGGGEVDLQKERRLVALLDRGTAAAYKEKHDQLNELGMLQYDRRRQLAAIADRLKGHRAADIRALGQQMARVDEGIEKARSGQLKIERRLSEIATEEQSKMRRLTRLAGGEPGVVIEATFFSFVRSVLEATIERYRERVRANVEASANSMFLRLIRDPQGYGGLRIAADYRVEVLDRLRSPRETSEGGKQLLALSLIGALKHAAVRGGPVVLDSPLGRLDLEHRANVLQTWIPSLGNQAILLVQSGELTREDAHRLLGARIGREFQIVRPSGNPEYVVIEGVSRGSE